MLNFFEYVLLIVNSVIDAGRLLIGWLNLAPKVKTLREEGRKVRGRLKVEV